MSQPSSKEVKVFLVHGTWARGVWDSWFPKDPIPEADWTKDKESARRVLTEEFKKKRGNKDGMFGKKITFIPIPWRGRNSEKDREEGAQLLLKKLGMGNDVSNYIIAHSYGGDVAQRAVSRIDKEQKVKGVVCLHTPFLNVLKRDFVSFENVFIFLIFLLMVLIPQFKDDELYFFILMSSFLGLFFLFGSKKIKNWSVIRLEDYHLFAKMPVKNSPFLCVTCAGDEAISGVLFLESLANLFNIIMSPWVIRWVLRIFLITIVLASGIHVMGFGNFGFSEVGITVENVINFFNPYKNNPSPVGSWSWYFKSLSGPMVGICILYLFVYIISFISSYVVRGITHGRWSRWWGDLFGQCVVSRIPYYVNSTEFWEVDASKGDGMVHSNTTENDEAWRKIARWIIEIEDPSEVETRTEGWGKENGGC